MEKQDIDGHATESEKLISIKVEVPKSSLATSIRKMLGGVSPISPDCSIFRAPKRNRLWNEKAFDPSMVSIGPYHHGKEELKSMEKRKAAYLNAFLNRCSDTISLETCIDAIREWEQRIRNCYEETIEFNSDDFVKMILLDSCFVIEVLWRCDKVNRHEAATDRLSHLSIVGDVRKDMILLENQLPFFVLQGLFDLADLKPREYDEYYFTYLCINYLSNTILSGDRSIALRNIIDQGQLEIKHLLDLLRMCQAPSIPRHNPKHFVEEKSMRSATQLAEAGMVIKPCQNYRSVADICYKTGFLEIPKLMVNSSSECVLRNLIALENCLYDEESYISDYIHFMDNLIDTNKDVELLIHEGVLQSFWSDSHQVATLINNLRPSLIPANYFYYGIEEEVNAYCKVPRHKWRATLSRDYCSSPWRIASTIAAILLLVLTFIQTVFSVIQAT